MNVHVPINIQEEFKSLEFRGKPFISKGRKLIKARHKTLEVTFFYSFEENFAWLITTHDSIPDWYLPKI